MLIKLSLELTAPGLTAHIAIGRASRGESNSETETEKQRQTDREREREGDRE